MRRKIVATGMAVLAVGFLAVGLRAQEQSVFKSQREKVSYGIGVQIAKDFKQQGLDIDVNLLAKGMKDGLAGGKLLMTEQEMMATLNAFQTEMNQKHAQAAKTAGDDSKKTGEAFLAANKKKEGVVALPSGLQYQIVKAGTGPKPSLSDKVECHYRGTLINGTEFDSSYKRGQPATSRSRASSAAGRRPCNSCRSDRSGSSLFPPIWPMASAGRAATSAPTKPSSSRSSCWASSEAVAARSSNAVKASAVLAGICRCAGESPH